MTTKRHAPLKKEKYEEFNVIPEEIRPVTYLSGSPSCLWLQLGNAEFITRMQKKINYYGSTALAICNSFEKPRVGELYCVQWSEDGGFYRGLVTSEKEDGSYLILYVDYGNTDAVTSSQIYILETEFRNVPHQAVRCCIKGFEHNKQTVISSKNQKMFEHLCLSQFCTVEAVFERNIRSVTDEDAPKWVVSLFSTINIGDFVANTGLCHKEDAFDSVSKASKESSILAPKENKPEVAQEMPKVKNETIPNVGKSIKTELKVTERPPSPIPYENLERSKFKVENWLKSMEVPPVEVKATTHQMKRKPTAPPTITASSRSSEMAESDFKSMISSRSSHMSVDVENTLGLKVEPNALNPDQRQRHVFVFSHVESANLFYVTLTADTNKVRGLYEDLNSHFKNLLKSQRLPGKIVKGSIIAAHFKRARPDPKKLFTVDEPLSGWYRAEVVEVFGTSHLIVVLIDHGLKTELRKTDIQPLPKRFFHKSLPRFAIPCRFAGITVTKPKDVVELLRCIGRGESHYEELEMLLTKDDVKESPVPVTVFFWTRKPGAHLSYVQQNGDLFNEILVENDFAENDLSTSHTSAEDANDADKNANPSQICDQNFNPMEEDFHGRLPQFPNPLGGSGDYNNVPRSQRPCKFYRFNGKCHSGKNCEFSHIFTGESFNVKPEETANVIMDHNIDPPNVGSVVVLEVTCVYHPGTFFAVLPFGCLDYQNHGSGKSMDQQYLSSNPDDPRTNLASLQIAMTQFYKNVNLTGRFTTGEIAAVRYDVDNRWYRAKVVSVSDARTLNDTVIKVVFVDFGNTYECTPADIRKLDKEDFKQLKFQAIECSLHGVVPLNGNIYSLASGKGLHDLTLKRQMMARVMDVSPNDRVSVDLYFEGSGGIKVSVADALIEEGLVSKARFDRAPTNSSRIYYPG